MRFFGYFDCASDPVCEASVFCGGLVFCGIRGFVALGLLIWFVLFVLCLGGGVWLLSLGSIVFVALVSLRCCFVIGFGCLVC